MSAASERDVIAIARNIIEREAAAVKALADQFDEGFADVVRILLDCKGHVLVTGSGTSHAMAERFAHLLSCCGTPALCIDAADARHGGSGAITADDVVFIISKGGQSVETIELAKIARKRGAKVIAQTETLDSPLSQLSDVIFHVETVGDVDPYGVIATGSSLVSGAAGDALCVVLLDLRGYSLEDFSITHPGGAVGVKLAGIGNSGQ